MFKKHCPKLNLDKTEVMRVGKQREELNIRMEGKYVKQVSNCMHLGGNISENGRLEEEVRRRIQAGAGNDGQKNFQKTEGGGHGFLRGAS